VHFSSLVLLRVEFDGLFVCCHVQDCKSLRERLLALSDADLAAGLDSLHVWPFEVTDLHLWIPVLDRFDAILTRYTSRHLVLDREEIAASDLCKGMPGDIASTETADRPLLLAVLRFSALLMANTFNAEVYNSLDVSCQEYCLRGVCWCPNTFTFTFGIRHPILAVPPGAGMAAQR